MTAPHAAPPATAPDLDAALSVLRDKGLRVSTPRRLTLEALYATETPRTADQIAARVGLDVASTYRNLDTLESVGLVRHFHLGHGPGLYVRTETGVREYLLCDSCQELQAVQPGELDKARAEIEQRFGFQASFTHFPIVGRCAKCAGGE